MLIPPHQFDKFSFSDFISSLLCESDRPIRLTQCYTRGYDSLCTIIMWHSHLNDIEIPETKRFIPKGFELVTTLSKPNRPVSQFIRDAIGLLVSVKPGPIPRRSLLPRCPREVWKQPGLTEPRTPRDNAELSRLWAIHRMQIWPGLVARKRG